MLSPEIGVEHCGVVSGDGAHDAGVKQARQGVVGEACHDAGTEIRDGAHVEYGPTTDQLLHEPHVVDGSDSVSDSVSPERFQGAANRFCSRDLTGVRYRRQAQIARHGKGVLIELGRELSLESTETHTNDAAVTVASGGLDEFDREILWAAAIDVGRETDFDAVLFACGLRAVAIATEEFIPRNTLLDALGRREDPFDVDATKRGCLRRVVHDNLVKVLGGLERVGRENPDLDEVGEVPKLVQAGKLLHGAGRQGEVVSVRDLEERRRPNGAFQMYVQFDFGVPISGHHDSLWAFRTIDADTVDSAHQLVRMSPTHGGNGRTVTGEEEEMCPADSAPSNEPTALAEGMLRRTVRFIRMAGTSIAAPTAAPWVTDFLNASYYARRPDERSVDDLRLAFSVLTTRWHRTGRRRLGLHDLPAFHRAFGSARLSRRGRMGRLTRDDLFAGADRLLGDWFSSGYAEPGRRGWGIVFRDRAARDSYRPEDRMRSARLGPLSPPATSPDELRWKVYQPVVVADVDVTLDRLLTPEVWPDFGSDHGRFTPLRPGGLEGQTFEIEVVAGAQTRHPILTRGYVTATRVIDRRRPDELATAIQELDVALAPREYTALSPGQHPVAVASLTTHLGHFIGPARSHLVLSDGPGGAELRDIGVWDPMTFPVASAYRFGGRTAQAAFWGEADPDSSMLHQFAAN